MRLEGKVAIVTGASRGIGFAVAEAFAREGAKVAVCGSKLETAQKGVDKILQKYPNAELLPIGVSMTNSEEISQMVETCVKHFGTVDTLVCNAGITRTKAIMDMTDDDFDSVIHINLGGAFKCIREVAKVMKEKGGSIINTSSMIGTYGGAMQSAYATSKFAINGLTKSAAKELGSYNIRVNAVAPGVVGTDMVTEAVSDEMLQGLKSMTPLGRMADPTELAGAYVYLASDESSFTTGAIIAVDGGIVM